MVGAATVMAYSPSTENAPLSVAPMRTSNVPAALGVPEITPPDASVSPGGRAPPTTL